MTKWNLSQIRSISVTLLTSCLLCSCSHQKTKSSVVDNRIKNRRASASLHQAIKKQQSVIEELREKNLVLEQRLSHQFGSDTPETPKSNPTQPLAAPSTIKTATAQLPANMSVLSDASVDQTLYGKVLEAFGRHNLAETQTATESLIRSSKDSIHADNALLLTGRLALEKSDRALALKYMNRLLREYPNGNKAVSALFLRGIIQKQMGQFAGAKQDLTTLARIYPGSPEAQRVRWELKTFATEAVSSKKEM